MKNFKKFLMVFAICLIIPVSLLLTACGKHTAKTEWEKNDTYHWHKCTTENCTEEFDKSEHDWNDGEITAASTCENQGVKTYTCKVCNTTKTESLPLANHTGGTATCLQKAECTVCGEAYGDLAQHDWDDGITKHYDTYSCTLYNCKNCDETKEENITQTPAQMWETLMTTTKNAMLNKTNLTFNTRQFNGYVYNLGVDTSNNLFYSQGLDEGYAFYNKVINDNGVLKLFHKSSDENDSNVTEVSNTRAVEEIEDIVSTVFGDLPETLDAATIKSMVVAQVPAELRENATLEIIGEPNIDKCTDGIYTASFSADLLIGGSKYAKIEYEIIYSDTMLTSVIGKQTPYIGETLNTEDVSVFSNVFAEEFNLEAYNNCGHFIDPKGEIEEDNGFHYIGCFYEGCIKHKYETSIE